MRNETVTVLVALSNAWVLTMQAADFPEPTKGRVANLPTAGAAYGRYGLTENGNTAMMRFNNGDKEFWNRR